MNRILHDDTWWHRERCVTVLVSQSSTYVERAKTRLKIGGKILVDCVTVDDLRDMVEESNEWQGRFDHYASSCMTYALSANTIGLCEEIDKWRMQCAFHQRQFVSPTKTVLLVIRNALQDNLDYFRIMSNGILNGVTPILPSNARNAPVAVIFYAIARHFARIGISARTGQHSYVSNDQGENSQLIFSSPENQMIKKSSTWMSFRALVTAPTSIPLFPMASSLETELGPGLKKLKLG